MVAKISGLKVVATLASAVLLRAADWTTFGGNPQRDGWAKEESTLTKENVKDLKLAWKIQLESSSKELNSLTAPLVVEKLVTPRGFKDAVIVAGASDIVFAVDTDNGKLLWQKKFTVAPSKQAAQGFLCPNALNATPVVDNQMMKGTVYVLASDGTLHFLNDVDGADRVPPIP